MSLGQQALILIELDRVAPTVVPVDDLAQYMALPVELVRRRIRELAEMGHVLPLHDVQTAMLIGASTTGPLPGMQGKGPACA